MESQRYPEVEAIVAAVGKAGLTFEAGPRSPELDAVFYRRLIITTANARISVPVMDEYEDVDRQLPAVLLHLVLQECEFFEDAADYATWAADVEVDPESSVARSIYRELELVTPQLRALLGNQVRAVSSFDIQLNTGVARALRQTGGLPGENQ